MRGAGHYSRPASGKRRNPTASALPRTPRPGGTDFVNQTIHTQAPRKSCGSCSANVQGRKRPPDGQRLSTPGNSEANTPAGSNPEVGAHATHWGKPSHLRHLPLVLQTPPKQGRAHPSGPTISSGTASSLQHESAGGATTQNVTVKNLCHQNLASGRQHTFSAHGA